MKGKVRGNTRMFHLAYDNPSNSAQKLYSINVGQISWIGSNHLKITLARRPKTLFKKYRASGLKGKVRGNTRMIHSKYDNPSNSARKP